MPESSRHIFQPEFFLRIAPAGLDSDSPAAKECSSYCENGHCFGLKRFRLLGLSAVIRGVHLLEKTRADILKAKKMASGRTNSLRFWRSDWQLLKSTAILPRSN